MTSVEVIRDDDSSRYEAYIDGEMVGFAEFHIAGEKIVFPHTVTDPGFAGRGVASALARASLDDVRNRGGLQVVPQCSFYAGFIASHPEYATLVG